MDGDFFVKHFFSPNKIIDASPTCRHGVEIIATSWSLVSFKG